jgi:NAD(P) transhydrogenase
MSAQEYDLVVIGSGPAGQRAAVAAAKMGKRVMVVEARSVVGGVCINTGTIPSKTMREAVLHLSGYNYRSIYGVNYRVKEKITMADLAFRVQAVIKTEVDVTEAQLSRNGIDVVHGIARFLDPHQIRVEGPQGDTTLSAGQIIIAVGTKPAASDKVPVNGKTIINSDQILGLDVLPKDACRGGRRRHRRGIRLHVRSARRARHADRKAQPAARVRRPGDY